MAGSYDAMVETKPNETREWYAVIDQNFKIVYRGIDLERAAGMIEKGRLYGKGETKEAAEAAARERMSKWLEEHNRIQLAKAAS